MRVVTNSRRLILTELLSFVSILLYIMRSRTVLSPRFVTIASPTKTRTLILRVREAFELLKEQDAQYQSLVSLRVRS
jgi:hypothetical protein